MKTFFTLIVALGSIGAMAQTPEIYSWELNTTGATGYSGIAANCQAVQYNTTDVYVTATGIPSYTIGPWPGNPNVATDQGWVFQIPRFPVENTGTNTAVGLGQVGVCINGVVMFNAKDAFSYNNDGVWFQCAPVFEAQSFDATGGHPSQPGTYHYHQDPSALHGGNNGQHSGIIGFAFDGFPVYGPYGYDDPNDTQSGIVRIETAYQLRGISDRTTLAGGITLQPNEYGPSLAAESLGSYIEDYEYVANSGHLDQYNGRECTTPEYPNGTYAYFTSLDASGDVTYPYMIGPEYYGIVETANTGPQGAHVNVPGGTTTWDGVINIGFADMLDESTISIYPNPTTGQVFIVADGWETANVTVLDAVGQKLQSTQMNNSQAVFALENVAAGVYYIQLELNGQRITKKLLKS
jgi:hypothetical protein